MSFARGRFNLCLKTENRAPAPNRSICGKSTMPNLTTQSIGIVAGPLTPTSQVVNTARAAHASIQAGINKSQNQTRALNSATEAKDSRDRSIQREKRVEGVFPGETSNRFGHEEEDGLTQKPGRLSRIA